MTHLSRFSEELVLWTSAQFDFVNLPDRFCTGSSIMPQKKNPDVPELVRGKSGRVNGHLMSLLTLMKSQPLAYNKDNQEDKEPLFDSIDTVRDCLHAFADMVPALTVKKESCARRRAAASPPPPIWRTTWCARACRSATPTRWSARRWQARNHAGGTAPAQVLLAVAEARQRIGA
jgi:argininosuccinate lyase